jgi:hypothetical protein
LLGRDGAITLCGSHEDTNAPRSTMTASAIVAPEKLGRAIEQLLSAGQ